MKAKTWLTLSITAALSVSSLNAEASSRRERQAQEQQQRETQQFVDARMHETLSSIDQSLNTLLSLSRSGEGPRRDDPIADTVAGAAAPDRAPELPEAVPAQVQEHLEPTSPSTDPVTAATAEQSVEQTREARRAEAQAVLQRQVDIRWDGSAEALLSNVAHQMGFTFRKTGSAAFARHARLDVRGVSLSEALDSVANQIEREADVRVLLDERVLELHVRGRR